MEITDLNGKPIEVTDLDKAIEQAENYKDAQHDPPAECDKKRQAYWTDVYNKLLELKNQIS